MSHHRPLIGAAILLLGACAGPQVDIEAETAAIRERGEALVAAESAMDTEASLAFWTPDAIVQGHAMPQMAGHDGLRTVYQGFFAALAEFGSTTTHIEVAASGDLAWEYGVNRSVVAAADGNLLDMGKYLAVWRKVDGTWYVAAVAFTSDAAAPGPM